jgi:hypothetical protein
MDGSKIINKMKKAGHIILLLSWNMMLISCGSSEQREIKTLKIQENMDTVSSVLQAELHIENVFSFPWKEGNNSLNPSLGDRPFASVTPNGKPMEHVYQPASFKICADGTLTVMNYKSNSQVSFLYKHGDSGDFKKINLSIPVSVFDFVLTNSNRLIVTGLADLGKGMRYHLIIFNEKGNTELTADLTELNRNLKSVNKSGDYINLLIDFNNDVYLVASAGNRVIPVDVNTASLKPEIKVDSLISWPIESIHSHKLFSTRYESKQFFFQSYDLQTGKISESGGHAYLKGLRTTSLGFDRDGNEYVFIQGDNSGICMISPQPDPVKEIRMDAAYYRSSDSALFMSWRLKDSIIVKRAGKNNAFFKSFLLPDDLAKRKDGRFKISSVSQDGTCRILYMNGIDLAEQLLIYDADGQCHIPTDKIERLQLESELHTEAIQVDPQGNLYLPITDPEGFKIIKCKLE